MHAARARRSTLGSFAALTLALAACGGGASGPATPNGAAASTGGGAGAQSAAGTGGVASGDAGTTGAAGSSLGGTTGAAGEASGGAGGATESSAGAGGDVGAAGATGGAGGGAATLTTKDFTCNEVVGLWVASQWWGSFEKGVENAKWQFTFQHHGYLEMFADPASPYWANAVSSKCTTASDAPDRVVFLPFSLTLSTLDGWVTNLTKVVAVMKSKFPAAKRIELMTTLRSPGNMPCANDTDPNTVVAPYVDQAIQMVADASGGLVTVGAKIELGNCSWWAGGTDLTGAGNTGAGELLSTYYQTH